MLFDVQGVCGFIVRRLNHVVVRSLKSSGPASAGSQTYLLKFFKIPVRMPIAYHSHTIGPIFSMTDFTRRESPGKVFENVHVAITDGPGWAGTAVRTRAGSRSD